MPKFPINLGSYTTQELCDLNEQVVALIKLRRSKDASSMRRQLSLGDEVIVNDRHSTQEGVIKKIMRTRAIVTINGRDWRVPMNMLSHKNSHLL